MSFRTLLSMAAVTVLAVLPGSAQEYAFRSFTVNDGLVSNYITAMHQDSRGQLWIGTDEGFSVFDGATFRNIHPPKRPMWGHINAFFESRVIPGVMWIATNGGGVLRYSDGRYRILSVDTLLSSNRVNDLVEDPRGRVWCSTDNGMYCIDGAGVRRIPLPTRVGVETEQLITIGDDSLWITYPFGIIAYSVRTGRTKEIYQGYIGGVNRHLAVSGTDTFCVYMDGLLQLRNGSFRPVPMVRHGQYGILVTGPDGKLWCGTTEGVLLLRPEARGVRTEQRFDRSSGLPVNDVSTIVPGREGEVWFGTPGKGIVRLQDPQNFRFRFDALTARGTVDAARRIWVPTQNGMSMLERTADQRWNSVTVTNGTEGLPISIVAGGGDTLYYTTLRLTLVKALVVRTRAGTVTLRTLQVFDRRSGVPPLFPNLLFRDSRGWLWCAQDHNGVVVIRPNDTRAPVSVFNGFAEAEKLVLSGITETTDGRVFAGGNGSNSLLEFVCSGTGARLAAIHRYDSLISTYGIRSLAPAPDGGLWIGTRYDGLLHRSSAGEVRQYTYDDGLHSMQVLSLYQDSSRLWIGTQSGMEFVPDVRAPRFIVSAELTRSPIYIIGRYDDRKIWAMSRYELTLNDAVMSEQHGIVPPMSLSRFAVNGIAQPLEPGLEFTQSGPVSCSFSYSCITLRGDADVRYEYRLEGLHTAWQPSTPERSVTFANLGAGRFTFRVRAVLNNGERVTETAEQEFILVPPFWNRWWFTPLMVLMAFSLITWVYLLRIRQRLALEEVRLSIAADLHDDIGSVLARIANLADILMLSSPKRRIAGRPAPGAHARTIAELSRELMEKMSDVVWSVDPKNDDPERLIERLRTAAAEFADLHHIAVDFAVDGSFQRRSIDPQRTRAALLIVKEALTNILKHAEATHITLTVEVRTGRWSITVTDNGVGFDEAGLSRVNGIYNMRSRAEACGGSFSVTARSGAGTTVHLDMPL